MSNPFNSGPIAPQRNPAIEPQYYEPSRFVITAISEGINTIVTTNLPHNYVVGQEVRLLIPVWWGAYELNNQKGFVLSVPSTTQVTVSIDSFGASPFILSTIHPLYPQQPQIIAIGDVNSGAINPTPRQEKSYIPGSFRNISPN